MNAGFAAARREYRLGARLGELVRQMGASGAVLVGSEGVETVGDAGLEPAMLARLCAPLLGARVPTLRHVELDFERGRVILFVLTHGVLMLRFASAPEVRLRGLSSSLVVELEQLLEQAQLADPSLDTGPEAELRARLVQREDELRAQELQRAAEVMLERLVELCRRRLGPLVVRNYLRETQRVLEHDYPGLRGVRITLGAELVREGEAPEGFVRAMGAWCAALLRRVAKVSPQAAAVDLHALAGPAREPLEAAGFFKEVQS